jgi:hypothetical protein
MSDRESSDLQDRFWHFIWALAGVVALGYGVVGIVAQLTQGNRHVLALPWFIIAAIGGLSMISFVWRSSGD